MINRPRILIIDDEDVALRNLERTFRNQDYEIFTASTGPGGLKMIQENRFDVVLTDLRMETVDGQKILEECRLLHPETEVIMITGYATVDSAIETMKKGAYHYIAKPFHIDEVRKTVAEAIEKVRLKFENLKLQEDLNKTMHNQLLLVSQCMAGMVHRIKNIMTGLEGGIYVVNQGLEAKDQEEVRKGWDIVQLNCDKISKLVRDIHYSSKDREPNFQTLKPNKVIREACEPYKETARSYDVELKLNLDEDLDRAVIDPEGLQLVIANLVTNAMDACKADLWKDHHLIELRSRKGSDGSTIVEVTDNGVVMDDAVQDRMFGDIFTLKGHQKTGLGLMVTAKVMEEHGGTISFHPARDTGTTVTVVFPPRTGALPE